MATARKPKPAPAPTITPGEQRIELQLEGLRSVVSGGFLALSQSMGRVEQSLDELTKIATLQLEVQQRTAAALEHQNRLLAQRSNGHDLEPLSSTT